MNKRVCKKPAPAEANSLRRADFEVPILGTWLPLPHRIDVVKDEQTGNAGQLTWKRRTVQDTRKDLPGVYCLRTSHKDPGEKTLWHSYTMLTDLDAVFRSLKSELGIRPVFHQVTERVTGHLFISVSGLPSGPQRSISAETITDQQRPDSIEKSAQRPEPGDGFNAIQGWANRPYQKKYTARTQTTRNL